MTVAAALLLYVAAVLTIAPKLLVHITADGEAPRLAIAAWATAVVAVLVNLLLVVALVMWRHCSLY